MAKILDEGKKAVRAGEPYIYTKDLEGVILVALLTPWGDPSSDKCIWGIPILIWGAPGIGKSGRISYIALLLGLPPEITYPAGSQPENVSGALVPDGSGGGTIFPLLPGVMNLIKNKYGVWVIDELSCARPAVQAAYLGAVYERRVGQDKLPGGIRIIAAANPPEEAAGGWELEPPMANRFCHIYMKPPSVEDWTDWLMNEQAPEIRDIEASEDLIKKNWNDEYSRAKGLVTGYLKSAGEDSKLHDLPPEGHPDRGGAWPSPRTWEMATRFIASTHILKRKDVLPQLLAGCLGKGISLELETYLADSDLPTPEEVLSGKWKPDDRRIDKAIAAYVSATATVINTSNPTLKHDRAVQLWKALEVACQAGMADIAVRAGKSLVRNKLGRGASQEMAEAAKPVLLKMGKSGFAEYV